VSDEDPAGLPSPSYDLLNLSIGSTLVLGGQVNSLTLRLDNTLDEKYVDATSRIKSFAFNPGRNFSLLYRVQF
jgi:iron complex outermembrane recepter protein